MSVMQHVFVLMLENRSYDNIFGLSDLSGTLPDGTPTTAKGLPVQPAVNVGRTGTSYQLGKGSPYFLGFDPGHEFTDTCVQMSGLVIANADAVRNDKLALGSGGYPPVAVDPSTTGFAATYEDHGYTVAHAFSAFTPDQVAFTSDSRFSSARTRPRQQHRQRQRHALLRTRNSEAVALLP